MSSRRVEDHSSSETVEIDVHSEFAVMESTFANNVKTQEAIEMGRGKPRDVCKT